MGLIQATRHQYVRCANHKDRDIEYRPNRNCGGEIVLVEGQDEADDAFVCSICDRPVYPRAYSKEQFTRLTIKLQDSGVETYLAALASETFGPQHVRRLDSGVYRVDVEGDEITLILTDTMGQRYNKLQSLGERRCLLVIADTNTPSTRLPSEPWLAKVTLAELVSGTRSLADCVRETLRDEQPRSVTSTIPLFSANRPIQSATPAPTTKRQFVVELREATVLVNDVAVFKPNAKQRYQVFVMLWNQFLDDLRNGLAADDFTRINIRAIMKVSGETDEGNARKVVNNLQTAIADLIRQQIGLPIDREDVVQTCKMKDQSDTSSGYRINPFTVIIRPRQT